MKSRKHNKEFIVITSLYLASVLTFAAGALGTYAWYSYNARASAYYNGAAIGDGGSLEVGIFSDVEVEKFSAFSDIVVDKTSIKNRYIYWANGGFSEKQTAAYCESFGYAVDRIGPCSTGKFIDNDSVILKRAPNYLFSQETLLAGKENYVYLPLVFKMNGQTNIAVSLNGVSLESPDEIKHSVRVAFFDSYNFKSFIFNPTSQYDGSTDVGGLLDLNKDGFYDYRYEREYPYGAFKSWSYTTPYKETIRTDKEHSTFDADHLKGIVGVDYVPETAKYYGTDSVLNGKTLAISNSSGLARLDTFVYVEGWDRSCIDKGLNQPFKINFEFILGDYQDE